MALHTIRTGGTGDAVELGPEAESETIIGDSSHSRSAGRQLNLFLPTPAYTFRLAFFISLLGNRRRWRNASCLVLRTDWSRTSGNCCTITLDKLTTELLFSLSSEHL